MSDFISGSKPTSLSTKDKIRCKYRQQLQSTKYDNLKNVPPHLQKHSKRFIDGKSKGLGTSRKQTPISVLYPTEMENVLRSMKSKTDYIRHAVLEKMHKDGLALDYELPDLDN